MSSRNAISIDFHQYETYFDAGTNDTIPAWTSMIDRLLIDLAHLPLVAFTLVRFRQYASSFGYILNICCILKHNNLLSKKDQREQPFC